MVNKFTFIISYSASVLKRKIKSKFKSKFKSKHLYPRRYAGKKMLSLQEGNDLIYSFISSDAPCMIARYGTVELGVLKWRVAQRLRLKKHFDESNMYTICNNAGFFPNDQEKVKLFSDLLLAKSSLADFLVCLYPPMEDYIIKNYAPSAKVADLKAVEPWYVETPWTRGLRGKKVLVIHPFEESIISQYNKRESLFPGTDILPDFQLKTLKAVQTIAGETDTRFSDWFEALDYMYHEALKIDFDIALIGCGAYGFPLAAMLKEAGKKAIHMGGCLQLLFGIKGQRWENNEAVIKYSNDDWIYPSSNERPKNLKNVEGGCYW